MSRLAGTARGSARTSLGSQMTYVTDVSGHVTKNRSELVRSPTTLDKR